MVDLGIPNVFMSGNLDFIGVGILTRPPRVVGCGGPPVDLYPPLLPHPTPSRQVLHHCQWVSSVSRSGS